MEAALKYHANPLLISPVYTNFKWVKNAFNKAVMTILPHTYVQIKPI